MTEIRAVTAADVRPLRQRILRPHQTASALVYGGDAAPETMHVGAFIDDKMIGVASIFRQAPEYNVSHPAAWRVRGMATLDDHRGKAVGAKMMQSLLRHAATNGGRLAWCNARVPAIGFYSRMGFEQVGAVFDLPVIGPHVIMERPIKRR
ncbi:MAG: GNAT superfamily N-acetyltransferase [Bradymonadia bacterium]|jgi:GNAT superfamily N-acetyltransferase